MFVFLALSLDALAVPAQTLVAEELGRGLGRRPAEVAARAVRLSLVAGGVLSSRWRRAPVLPHLFTGDEAVADRATAALWWLAAMLVPAAVAFAYDGVLIGAGDYRFLGRAAFGYLVAVAPLGAARAARTGARHRRHLGRPAASDGAAGGRQPTSRHAAARLRCQRSDLVGRT